MAFTFGDEVAPAKVELKAGRLRASRGERPKNEVGVQLELDTNSGELAGKIVFYSIRTGIKDKATLARAVETFINENLKAKL